MKKLFLVCTRSAISGSALVYIINQSPDCYNAIHDNLWIQEYNTDFGNATTINDYWNIPDHFKTVYNAGIRNAEHLSPSELINLNNAFQDSPIKRNLAVFTHAINISELQQTIDDHNLDVQVVTTKFGTSGYDFVNSWLRREYSTIMNEWTTIPNAIARLVYEVTGHDGYYDTADTSFEMVDWLKTPNVVYDTLGIARAIDIDVWLEHYHRYNGYDPLNDHELYEGMTSLDQKIQVYLSAMMHMLHTYKNEVNDPGLFGQYCSTFIKIHNMSAPLVVHDKAVRESIKPTTSKIFVSKTNRTLGRILIVFYSDATRLLEIEEAVFKSPNASGIQNFHNRIGSTHYLAEPDITDLRMMFSSELTKGNLVVFTPAVNIDEIRAAEFNRVDTYCLDDITIDNVYDVLELKQPTV